MILRYKTDGRDSPLTENLGWDNSDHNAEILKQQWKVAYTELLQGFFINKTNWRGGVGYHTIQSGKAAQMG